MHGWYHDTIERGLTHGGNLDPFETLPAKSADNAARLAALFQMFERISPIGMFSTEQAP